jgi:hypothetical protein|tara:strand:- start:1259 stop:1831 length:573 start_codon:yes stop_codon:yes gene_type:complete
LSFEFDIRRTIILSKYMNNWGMPEYRNVTNKGNHCVELYSFPEELFTRFATVGLSSGILPNSDKCNSEIVMVLPTNVVAKQTNEIVNYIFDIVAYLIETLDRNLTAETTIPESELAPAGWPKALLFDEPRGEVDDLSCFHIGSQHVELFWMIPIFGNEYSLIKNGEIERFDEIVENMDIEITDVRRTSCV